jgi:hypothetical protein
MPGNREDLIWGPFPIVIQDNFMGVSPRVPGSSDHSFGGGDIEV